MEQREWEGKFFKAPVQASRVRVTKRGDLMASLDVPEGVFLSIYYDHKHPFSVVDGCAIFRGDVEIRALPANERSPDGSSQADAIMEEAPLVMAVEDVEVVVEPLEPSRSRERVEDLAV